MCKISCTDLFNFRWVCDYHIKPTETRQLIKGQLQRFHKLSLFDRFRHVENGFDIIV